MDSVEGAGTHVTIVVHEDQALSVLGVDAARLSKWLEELGCTTAVVRPEPAVKAHGLSSREREIVALIGSGLSNAQISSRLFLSINTIKSYVRAAYRKMNVTDRPAAVRWAIRHDLAQAENDADHHPVDDDGAR